MKTFDVKKSWPEIPDVSVMSLKRCHELKATPVQVENSKVANF